MKKTFFPLTLLLVSLLLTGCASSSSVGAPDDGTKRQFRGAWIQAVNGQWTGVGRDNMQRTLTYQLDELQKDGVNAIIFQVRPECDALYESKLEPWSRFLTGQQGLAPQPYWDPLQWMVDECHRRGMELHAWINPYRAKTKTTNELATSHVAVKHPDWVFSYDGLYILNPALEASRQYTCRVVEDIVSRYDVDGLHIRNLLITFFMRFYKQLVMDKRVFILETPLFRVRNKKEQYYCFTEEEREAAIAKCGRGAEITRFKGLGELNPEEFADFIGPDMRLTPVGCHDGTELDKTIKFYMGANTPERKDYIMDNLVCDSSEF